MKFGNDNNFSRSLKRILSTVLSAALCAALCAAPAANVYAAPQTAAVPYVEGPNLLQNGDFSNGATGWTKRNQADTMTVSKEGDEYYLSYSNNPNGWRYAYQLLSVESGATYYFTGYMRDEYAADVKRSVLFGKENGSSYVTVNFPNGWTANQWNYFSCSVTTDGEELFAGAGLPAGNKAGATMELKKLSVRKITMAAGNLLVDGGFEEPYEITNAKKNAGEGWYKNGPTNVNTEFDAVSGNHWVKISDRGNIWRMIRQSANLMAYHTYQLTLKYRLSDMKDGAAMAAFKLYMDNGSGKVYSGEAVTLTANADFQTATFTCTTQETGAHAVYIVDDSADLIARCIELDDVVLTDITDPDSFNYYEGFEEMETAPTGKVVGSTPGWFATDGDPDKSERTIDPENHYSGAKSLKKKGVQGGATKLAVYQKMLPQGSYHTSVWGKRDTTGVGSNKLAFTLSAGYYDASGTYASSQGKVEHSVGDTNWKKAACDFTLPYAQRVRWTFTAGWSTHDAWIDDFSVKALSIDFVETDAEAVRYTAQSMQELIADWNEGISLPVINKDMKLPAVGCYDTSIAWSGDGVNGNIFAVTEISGWTELTAVISKGTATDTFHMYVYVPNEGETYGTPSAMKNGTLVPADCTYAGNTAKVMIPVLDATAFNGIVIVAQYEENNGARVLKGVDLFDSSAVKKGDGYIRADVKYENTGYDMSVMVFNNINDIVPLCSANTVIEGQ